MQHEIKGGNFPMVVCHLDKGDTMISEKGAMAWMSDKIKMETSTGGGLLKGLARSFSGESVFLNYYTAQESEQFIAFSSSYAGQIMAVELSPGKEIVAQKHAFLAGEPGINIDIHFTRRLGAGFFGGEGFILQRLSGSGLVFLEIDGSLMQYDLQRGEKMIIDQGYLAAMEASVTFDIQKVQGVKNMLFGGEGMFVGNLTGPGKVWLQTMPIASLVNEVISHIPSK